MSHRFYTGAESTLLKCMLLLTFLASTFCAQSQRRPRDIEALFRNFFIEYITLRPESGTILGLPPSWGIRVQNDKLDDESEEGLKKIYALYRKYDNWLKEYDPTELTSSQRVASDVLKWFLENELQGEKFSNHVYIIHPMFGFHGTFLSLMTEHHRISNISDAEDYIARLYCVDNKIKQLLQRLDLQEKHGIIPPTYIVDSYYQMLNSFVQTPCDENLIYTSFRDRISNVESISNGSRSRLLEQCQQALENNVYPAYAKLIERVDRTRHAADENAGVWKLPNGDEYYRYCLHTHTTTDMTPEEIHNLGLKEVERIQKELVTQFKKIGITGSANFHDLLLQYIEITGNRQDEHYFFPPTEEGRIQTLIAYQAIIDSMQARLPLMFSIIPKAQVHVARVPEYKEQAIGTYYQPPKLDGSEGGIFYANLSNQHQKPGMKTLTYHEAVPGHHLQFALEQEQPEKRLFKALFFFTGYVEGWALYAEKLAGEYGFYNDIHSKIGYLRSELFRALRLVVDTGIHYKRWTREKVYGYMLANLGWSDYAQIDRYIVWPGQACAYKVGELKILELRKRAKEALGERFDIKEFHDVVLRHGSVPLEVLERLVNDYIESAKK
jgi:uncharacterized protein (DUF885 family)